MVGEVDETHAADQCLGCRATLVHLVHFPLICTKLRCELIAALDQRDSGTKREGIIGHCKTEGSKFREKSKATPGKGY